MKFALTDALSNAWPMIIIFTVILSSLRISYLFIKKEKFVLYKELLLLLFLIYILLLFYIVSFQDGSYGSSNFIPFEEIFRYDLNDKLFFTNVVGNILLFIPFGLFISYILGIKKVIPIIILTLISSISIEVTQILIGRVFDVDDVILNLLGGIIGFYIYKMFFNISYKLPSIFKKDWFINMIVILLILILFIFFSDFYKYLIGTVIK